MQTGFYNYHNFTAAEKSLADALAAMGVEQAAVAVGVFDGVHLGHQKLLTGLKERAGGRMKTVALTFFPHPRAVLRASEAPVLLMPLEQRVEKLKQYGADPVFVVEFTPEFAQMPPMEFLDTVFAPETGVVQIIGVGRNWRFGSRGTGDTGLLRQWCEANNIEELTVPELAVNGEVVSSSTIRRAVANGNLELARMMLGEPYRLTGKVAGGHKVASSLLSHPTANLEIRCGVLPPDGVYAADAQVGSDKKRYPAAVNIGLSPTFSYGKNERRIEVHLLGFDRDIYAETLSIAPLKYLRPERAFPDAGALKRQIAADIEDIRNICRTIGHF